MAGRTPIRREEAAPITGGSYFADPSPDTSFISSGCALLDCVLGGGWPEGRIANIIGDKSSGKTLLAIEACANFRLTHEEAPIWYIEAEAAFDTEYARALGMPVDTVTFVEDVFTIEEWYEKTAEAIKCCREANTPGLLVVDSLDALSDRAELDRAITDGSYGAAKAKKMSELFRRLVKEIGKSNILIIVVSQIREKMNAAFGEKYSRSGGKAMDFYASQCLWLVHTGRIEQTRNKVKRVTGVNIKAQCKKNKVGLPFRTAEFSIMFGFGVDDIAANLDWLESIGKVLLVSKDLDTSRKITNFKARVAELPLEEYVVERTRIAAIVKRCWSEVEASFLPKRAKY